MLTTWPQEKPPQPSPRSGPSGLRARVEHAGSGCRNPDRAAAVAGMGDGQNARRHGRGRAARRPARGVRGIPGIAGRTMQARLRGRHEAEFRTGALAEDGDAGPEETSGQGTGVVGDIVLVDAGAESGSRALEQIEILQQKRHAGEGTVRKSLFDLPLRIIIVLYDHRIDLRIDLGGAGDGFVQQFPGTDLLVVDEFGEPDRVVIAIFLESHIRTCRPEAPKLAAKTQKAISRERPD